MDLLDRFKKNNKDILDQLKKKVEELQETSTKKSVGKTERYPLVEDSSKHEDEYEGEGIRWGIGTQKPTKPTKSIEPEKSQKPQKPTKTGEKEEPEAENQKSLEPTEPQKFQELQKAPKTTEASKNEDNEKIKGSEEFTVSEKPEMPRFSQHLPTSKSGKMVEEKFPKIEPSVKVSYADRGVERVSTGVIGLDEKMEGGLVKNSMTLITGKTGTGKTAFSASFLYQGAKNNQPGVYITTEEREQDILNDIRAMFKWDFDKYVDSGMIKIVSIKPLFPSDEVENLNRLVHSYIINFLDEVMHSIEEINAERIVIDSVSIIEMFIRDEYLSRVALSSLLNNLRTANITALLTGTIPETSEGLSGGGIIEYLVDTVIKLEFMPIAEEHKRTITIRKMRRTDHSVLIIPFEVTPEGLKLFEVE